MDFQEPQRRFYNLVIKRKNIRPSGLLEVEADNTDTVDLGGFSDPIQTVGAKTAKFSGGSTMQANSGLRIGMTQLKINTGSAVSLLRNKSIEDELDATNTQNMIDNSLGTSGRLNNPSSFVIVDFTSVATAILKLRQSGSSILFNYNMTVEISDDNISYTNIANLTIIGTTTLDSDLGTRTWRYVRLTYVSNTGGGFVNVSEIFEDIGITDSVTVKVRSSSTLDTANGTILITDQVMGENESLTFDTDLLLTGNPTGDFVTVEIVSLTSADIPVTLSEITSIKEV